MGENHQQYHGPFLLVRQNRRLQICPLNIFGNKPPQMVPISIYIDIGETRVWRLDSGPNLQPCNRRYHRFALRVFSPLQQHWRHRDGHPFLETLGELVGEAWLIYLFRHPTIIYLRRYHLKRQNTLKIILQHT